MKTKILSLIFMTLLMAGCAAKAPPAPDYENINLVPNCTCPGEKPVEDPMLISADLLKRVLLNMDECIQEERIPPYDLPIVRTLDDCKCQSLPPETMVLISEMWFAKAMDLMVVCDASLGV